MVEDLFRGHEGRQEGHDRTQADHLGKGGQDHQEEQKTKLLAPPWGQVPPETAEQG
jgi:hypothetical protein